MSILGRRERIDLLLCSISETQFDLNRGNRIDAKHPQDVTGLVCSSCMQVLIASSQDKLGKAYQVALDEGMLDKARVLEAFLEEEIIKDGETKKSNRVMDRARALRTTQSTYHKIRPEHTTGQLDKRRLEVC